ncbi:protoporphyrinogen oxidase-like [Argiope bruennichi]|uniref:protoporphyrinogen oxidase-like n=1 Tax=Argiope bruennichi TaxID=94029 RepID=UPI0024942D01|nr:protoporphyrinogen oxidase-like [Argiope bruennichi]
MATVGILGGGISGLSCAYYLKTLGQFKIKYIFLLDKNPKFGGWIQTTRFPDGAVFEHGPRTLRVGTKAGYNALELADKLALSSRILPITREHPVAKTNFILANNQLLPLPREIFKFFRKSPPFSKPVISYIFKEIRTKNAHLDDESVYDFATRRIGEDVARYAFDPMCRGITAGDCRELSVRSMFPFMYESEKKHGSVIKGLSKSQRIEDAADFIKNDLVLTAYKEIWRMWTLKTGLGELIDALAGTIDERGKTDLIFDAKCSSLNFKDNKVEVVADNEHIEVDHVFSSIPSHELSPLLSGYPILADNLKAISSVDVAVVYLEYENDIIGDKTGFGYLVPSFEDSKVLGIVFDSCCFPELNGRGKTRLSCMIGGRWFKNFFGDPETVSEGTLLQVATEEVSKRFNTGDKPIRHKVLLQRNCIPQYVVGHYLKLQNIEEEIKKNNLNLSLIGASYKGAGVPDCIYNARLSVENYLKSL